jgi:hypothetical protein
MRYTLTLLFWYILTDAHHIAMTIHKYVWAEVGRLDSAVVNTIWDKLIWGTTDGEWDRTDVNASHRSSLPINVGGKLRPTVHASPPHLPPPSNVRCHHDALLPGSQ